jgi:hypothetical protein
VAIFLLIVFSSLSIFAGEDYVINKKYRGGNNLIYDCVQKIFICANDTAKTECEAERKEAIENKLENYPCAVLKTFPNKADCLLKNYEVANVNALKRYCHSDRLHH